ncbi:uncharacterized protein LOC132037087 isoform X3 [Lycium ferocissimum]|uniref:uncharacterized protein LOC132037087 isoform X3 n=1 Tax=Lycium ferocissimum TaxID=112874 RepID=UPI002815B643|nr:uncharacterized protein LOC132037087 isoform X3 [Lycium ferocissimum]
MDCAEQKRCQELAKSSSFYRRIYSEVEEIGWEHLVKFGEDMRLLSFRVVDKKGRVHMVQITLDGTYPNHPPSISADVPYLFNLKWSINSRLKDVIQQFQKDFWNLMDDIDHSLLVSDQRYPQRALSHRQLSISNDCNIILSIDADDPTSLPDCRFLGSDSEVERLRAMWRRNCKRWMRDKPFSENLAHVLDIQLHGPPNIQKTDPQIECGICYAQYLPIGNPITMMNLVLGVEVALIVHVKITAAVGPSTAFAWKIGCVPSQQQDSRLMFCLAIVHTVLIQLLSKSIQGSK